MANLIPKMMPLGPPPPDLPLDGMEQPLAKMPQIAQPQVTYAPDPQQQMIDHDQQQLQKVRWHEDNPWGTANNHPGTLGKIAHVLSVAGQIGGNIIAPNVVADIPGTQSNMRGNANALAERLGQETTAQGLDKEHAATTAKTEQDTALEPGKTQSTENYQDAETRKINDEIQQGPSLAAGYAHAVNQALKEGRDPSQDPIVQHISDAITSIQKQSAPKDDATKTVDLIGPDKKEHLMGWNPQTQKYDRDMGLKGEKPPVVNVNAATSALDRETARFAKPYEKAVADANTQLDKIADARAMINGSAEAQALGVPKVLTALVSGAGSGVRITQPELNAIAKARGLSGDVEGTINSWAGQGKLTATQKQQLTGILDDVKARILAKQQIHNEALDRINGAPDRNTVLQTEKDVRKRLSDLEQGGGGAKEGDTKVNGAGIKVKFSGGKWGPA